MAIVFGIISLILFILIIIILFQLQKITKQLEYINREEKTNTLITVGLHGLNLDKLATQINNLIKTHNKKEEELEYEKSKIKSQITSISHDLRTPLTSIVGYTELLKTTNNKEEKEKYIEIINKKSTTLQKLVEDFYEISLIEDKNYNLELEKITPAYILEDVLMEYFDDLKKSGIETNVRIEDFTEVSLNQGAISRVYQNLISNIKKHGIVEANVEHIKVVGKVKTIFTNKINPSQTLEENRLFEKFYTGEKSRHKQNSGIGMYSSKIILEKMGHRIYGEIKDEYMIITIEYGEE